MFLVYRSHVITTTHIVFEIHYYGVFLEYPALKYQYGKTMTLKVCKSYRMNLDQLLDLLTLQLEQEIRFLYFCCPRHSLAEGLHLIEAECHMRKMYDTAECYGLLHLYVVHAPQNLAGFYYKNLTYDFYDEEILLKFKKHTEAMLVATSKSAAALEAWEEEEGRSPPLRTPPSEPRIKGTNFKCRNLFKDFLHSDSIDDGLYFFEEDCMPGVVGLDVPAIDVGWSRSPPYEWQNAVLSYNGSKLPSLSNDHCFEDEVVLDVGGSAVHEEGGTSVHPTTGRRVGKKKYSRKFKFGSRTSYLRRRKRLMYHKALCKQRKSGGIGETISWFLNDRKLQSRVVVMKS